MSSKIEWLQGGETWNPVTGCSPVSEGCAHCYARRMSKRLAGRVGYPKDDPFRVTLHEDRVWGRNQPAFRNWERPRKIFVCSMSDLFHEQVPFDFIDEIFYQMKAYGFLHTFILLTKRPARMKEWVQRYLRDRSHWRLQRQGPGLPELPERIWVGISVENQQAANERIPILCSIPVAVRFVSFEPLLGSVDLSRWLGDGKYGHPEAGGGVCLPHLVQDGLANRIASPLGIAWIIIGGESGPGARPCKLEWIESLVDQCRNADLPVFVKQLGGWPDKRGGEKAVVGGRTYQEVPHEA